MSNNEGMIPETPIKPRPPMPGPGDYCPENSYRKTHARAYTFGIRAGQILAEPEKDDTGLPQKEKIRIQRLKGPPGPGAYDVQPGGLKGDQFSCSAFAPDYYAEAFKEHPERFNKGETPGPNKYKPTQSYKYSRNERDVYIREPYKPKGDIKKEDLSAASYFPKVKHNENGKTIRPSYKEKPHEIVKTNAPSAASYEYDWKKLHPGNHADKIIREPYQPPEKRRKPADTPAPNCYNVESKLNQQGARIGIRYNSRVNTF